MSYIKQYTPYMSDYEGEFTNFGNINWLPYVMYFHPYNFKSSAVNTDWLGFRYSEARGKKYSVADIGDIDSVRILGGTSTAFGIGASADKNTMASRLTEHDSRDEFWVNFCGRSLNSTQEIVLFSNNRHRLPKVKEIVLFGGFNDLALARLPAKWRMEDGGFFMCSEFFEAMENRRTSTFSRWFKRDNKGEEEDMPSLEEQMAYSSGLTLRHLANWRAFANDMGADLTFVLQPQANWIRQIGSEEEEKIFDELESIDFFMETYGDLTTDETYNTYSSMMKEGVEKLGVNFISFTPIIKSAVKQDDWLFVDRIHFNDFGYDLVAKLLLEQLTK